MLWLKHSVFDLQLYIEIWSLKSRSLSMVSPKIFSNKLCFQISYHHMQGSRGCFHFRRSYNDIFRDSRQRCYDIIPYFKCKKVSLKIYYLIKCFFTRKQYIVVGVIANCWFLANKNISFTKMLKKQGSKYSTLRNTWCNCYTKTVSNLTYISVFCFLGNFL